MSPSEFTCSQPKTQFELYLEEPKMDRNIELDILAYWKLNECRYPIVAAMARDILAVPVSTVASESSFSTGGRVLDAYRSRLIPSTVEALVCTRDWLYGNYVFYFILSFSNFISLEFIFVLIYLLIIKFM